MTPAAAFQCPQCRGSITALVCEDCGFDAQGPLGFPDFTSGQELPLAAGGTFDLMADRERAEQLGDESFNDMVRSLNPAAGAFSSRYVQRYHKMEEDAGDRHGSAILDKINARLSCDGHPSVAGGIALEAGGGHGRYLPGFSEVFDRVVFVDCSLVNLVLARQLALERGINNVDFIRADVTNLPFPDRTFSFVHQNGVIEHVHDPMRMVRESARVVSHGGVYACLSPNRYPLTPEPHFRVVFFGVFPPTIRRWMIRRTVGATDEAGTSLRSLRDLRRYTDAVGGAEAVYFLPPRLTSIARSTPMRRAVKRALEVESVRALLVGLANGPLLGIMPYHIALVVKSDT